MNKKLLLDRLYVARVSNRFDMKTILYIKNLLNNFHDKQETKIYLQNFAEKDQNLFYITEQQTKIAREYLTKRYLTRDKTRIRKNQKTILPDFNCSCIKNYHNSIRFLLIGFVGIKSYFSVDTYYEPFYRIIFENKKGDFHYEFDYFHAFEKDYEVVEEKILPTYKFSMEDRRIYIDEIIYL